MNFFNNLKHYFLKLIYDILNASLITFIVFIALENLKIGLISNYFDLNLLLVIAVGCIIIIMIFRQINNDEEKPQNNSFLYLLFVFTTIILLFLNLNLAIIQKTLITLIILGILLIYYYKFRNIIDKYD